MWRKVSFLWYKVGTGDDGHILKDRKFFHKSEEIFGGKWTTAEVDSFAALSFVDIKMRIQDESLWL